MKRCIRLSLIPLLLLLLSCGRPGIRPDIDRSSLNYYQRDFLELADYIRKTHAGFSESPLPAMTDEEYAVLIKEMIAEMEDVSAEGEFLIRTARFLTKLNDGHTRVYYPFDRFAPFTVGWFGDKLHIIACAEDRYRDLLYREVVTVGHKSIPEYESMINDYMPSDKNHLLSKRMASQEIMLSKEFLDYFGLLTAEGELDIGIKGQDGFRQICCTCDYEKVPSRAVSSEQGRNDITAIPRDKHNNWTVMPEEKALYFQLNKLQGGVDKKLYRALFTALKLSVLDYLIVDLRNNGGGNSRWCNEFLSYLIQEDRDVFMYKSWKSNYPRRTRQTGNGVTTIKPAAENLRFPGEVIFLTSPYTFSSATFFVVAALDNGLGTVIGEPPGNTCLRYGYCAEPVELPNSGLRIGTTHHIWGRAKPGMMNEGEYIMPDIYVEPDVEDFRNGRDTVYEAALEYISKK